LFCTEGIKGKGFENAFLSWKLLCPLP